jgi:hypothetical protein
MSQLDPVDVHRQRPGGALRERVVDVDRIRRLGERELDIPPGSRQLHGLAADGLARQGSLGVVGADDRTVGSGLRAYRQVLGQALYVRSPADLRAEGGQRTGGSRGGGCGTEGDQERAGQGAGEKGRHQRPPATQPGSPDGAPAVPRLRRESNQGGTPSCYDEGWTMATAAT